MDASSPGDRGGHQLLVDGRHEVVLQLGGVVQLDLFRQETQYLLVVLQSGGEGQGRPNRLWVEGGLVSRPVGGTRELRFVVVSGGRVEERSGV